MEKNIFKIMTWHFADFCIVSYIYVFANPSLIEVFEYHMLQAYLGAPWYWLNDDMGLKMAAYFY